jgi:bacterioferritin-associated ferredoxin
MNPNPLTAYFRQPSLYIQLPSQGQWWPDGSLVMPASRELPVMSMTAADEIHMKTPDALLSGQAIVDLIHNCVTNIKDAWHMPVVDLQALLVAIRIASVGERMQVQAQCPHCSEFLDYDIDLRTLFVTQDLQDWNQILECNGLQLKFRPLNYQQLTHIQNQVFQNQKYLQQIKDVDVAQQEQITNTVLSAMNRIELESLCENIHSITVNQHTVHERDHINEFVLNSEKKVYNTIKKHVDGLRKLTANETIQLMCDQCKFEFSSEFNLDYSNFFDLSS